MAYVGRLALAAPAGEMLRDRRPAYLEPTSAQGSVQCPISATIRSARKRACEECGRAVGLLGYQCNGISTRNRRVRQLSGFAGRLIRAMPLLSSTSVPCTPRVLACAGLSGS